MNQLSLRSFLAVALLTPALALAQDKPTLEAASRVTAVTVYPSQARITREAEVQLPAGESLVEFTGLPTGLDEDSVQVSGKTAAGVTILNYEIREVFGAESQSEQVRALQEQLKPLEAQQAEITDGIEVIAERVGFLNDVRKQLADVPDGPIPLSQGQEAPGEKLATVQRAYTLYSEELANLRASRRDLARQLEDLKPRIDQVKAEIERLSNQTTEDTYKVVLAIRAERPGAGTLQVHYVLEDAAWSPLYIARADTVGKKLSLTTQAKITQTTGEDWKDVALTLSTSRPNRGGVMPEIEPNYVTFTPPTPRTTRSRESASGGAQYEMMAPAAPEALVYAEAAPPPPMEDVSVESATVEQLGVSTVFQIATPVSVPSDDEPHLVNVSQQELEPKFVLETTPRLQADAFLKAVIKNSSGAPLLGGPVTIFRDGDMVGRSELAFVAVDEEYNLFLGIDDSVKVEFQKITSKQAESGMLNKATVAERQYQLKLKNFAKETRKVTVIDQVPVSQHEKLQVTDKQLTPAPKSVDGDSGKVTWEIEVPAGGEQKITNYYKVSWPKDASASWKD